MPAARRKSLISHENEAANGDGSGGLLPDPLTEAALTRLIAHPRYWQEPARQKAVEEGFRLLYPNRGHDAAGRLIRAAPREGRLADLRRLAAADQAQTGQAQAGQTQTAQAQAEQGAGGGPVHVDAYTRNGDEPVREHYRGLPDGGGSANTRQRPPSVSEENWQRYKPIFESGLVDIETNAAKAAKMSFVEFLQHVPTDGPWDFKNKKEFQELVRNGVVSSDLMQEFGNYHFGAMANQLGLSLGVTLAGAGTYQVQKQGGGDKTEALKGVFAAALPSEDARLVTERGFTWGDNPGDANAIMRGWLDAEKRKVGQ